ncbi:MAG: hypothetical protein GY874_12075 [Desulfobacteraceae bacterium]|nr:hypothetical protein [Desulfobacteraceae bacterium]
MKTKNDPGTDIQKLSILLALMVFITLGMFGINQHVLGFTGIFMLMALGTVLWRLFYELRILTSLKKNYGRMRLKQGPGTISKTYKAAVARLIVKGLVKIENEDLVAFQNGQ